MASATGVREIPRIEAIWFTLSLVPGESFRLMISSYKSCITRSLSLASGWVSIIFCNW